MGSYELKGSFLSMEPAVLTSAVESPWGCECGLCGKIFDTVSNLTKHMHRCTEVKHNGNKAKLNKPHSGKKLNTCPQCNKSFSRAYHLKTHMLTHTKEKPHTCPLCDNSFSLAGNLKKHMMTHSGEKPYTCQQCNKSFSQACNLDRHMMTHDDSETLG
jgi:KRAB domain-containing zinc finger protein